MYLPDELYNLKFAEHFKEMKNMYAADQRFKLICNTYCRSIKNNKKLINSPNKCFCQTIESENLCRELEEEILFYIIRRI